MSNPNKAELRRLCDEIENCGGIAKLMKGGLFASWVKLVSPSSVRALLDELEAKDNALLAITTRHFAESWSRRANDAKLDEYLSAGIAQLQAERDAALAELAQCRADSADVWGLAQGRADTIDELRAELEACKSQLQALIHISDATGWERHTCGEIAKARALLAKGVGNV